MLNVRELAVHGRRFSGSLGDIEVATLFHARDLMVLGHRPQLIHRLHCAPVALRAVGGGARRAGGVLDAIGALGGAGRPFSYPHRLAFSASMQITRTQATGPKGSSPAAIDEARGEVGPARAALPPPLALLKY
jgi:hypothetical protein